MIEMIEDVSSEVDENTKPATELNALALVNNQVAELDTLEAGFAELANRYKDVVYSVDTTKGMEEAKKARAEVRDVRYKAQAILKSTKSSINLMKVEFEAKADVVIERVSAIEDPIDAQIKAQEKRKEDEKAAAALAAAEAAEKIEQAMATLAFSPVIATQSSDAIKAEITRLESISIDIDVYGERTGEAMQIQSKNLDLLDELLSSKQASEKAAAELKSQQDALDAQRRAFEEEQAAFRAQQKQAADKAEAEAKAKRDEEDRIASERRAEEDRVIKERRRQEEEVRAAEQKRIDDAAAAERKRQDDELAARREVELEESCKRLEAEQARIAAEERVRKAAPSMLKALQVLIQTLDNSHRTANETEAALQGAREAILEATGVEA